MRLNEKIFTRPERQSVVVSEGVEGLEVNHSVVTTNVRNVLQDTALKI